MIRRFLCAIGWHFGAWHLQPNFHSYHGLELFRCDHCPHIGRARIVPLRRLKRRLSHIQ